MCTRPICHSMLRNTVSMYNTRYTQYAQYIDKSWTWCWSQIRSTWVQETNQRPFAMSSRFASVWCCQNWTCTVHICGHPYIYKCICIYLGNMIFLKNMCRFSNNQKKPAASLLSRSQGLGVSIHIQMYVVLINLNKYTVLVLLVVSIIFIAYWLPIA